MKLPYSRSIQVELGKVEGFWSALQLQQALGKYLNVEQQAHWLLMQTETNQLRHVNNDAIMSDRIIFHMASLIHFRKCSDLEL